MLPEGIQPKSLLPNYRYFDDARYFTSLTDIALDAGVAVADLYEPFKPVRTVRAGDAVKIGPQRFHVVVEKE